MKGGIVYSNFVTTVSPTHADEARFTDQGSGLEPCLNTHQGKFGGVLNGIDYDVWNPEVDPHIPSRYGLETPGPKIRQQGSVARPAAGCARSSSRSSPTSAGSTVRKASTSSSHAIFYALRNNAQFVLLGSSPESAYQPALLESEAASQ
jgi:starch synthase